ncbi:hypothetical protein NM208_g594 [Fusarium decemcellulare]|uniref:Uncharacterized protein n=1 Tax=Fusarium decemcellulare TaxID=57161 RepID=A0ACC1SZB3_9HYPO|nr:hypothetical protein NM208_g594 [Fusarium decemcellulare]
MGRPDTLGPRKTSTALTVSGMEASQGLSMRYSRPFNPQRRAAKGVSSLFRGSFKIIPCPSLTHVESSDWVARSFWTMTSVDCDGEPRKKWTRAKAPRYKTKRKDASAGALMALRPAPSIYNLACPADALLFHHAREYTIGEFDADSCSRFWYNFVLPLAHTVEPVKYALCALGGAHRRFVTGYRNDSAASSASEFELASIQKYNQAILHMKPLMAENSQTNLQTTLICCVIFICIENLHGRYTDSIRHLHAGCQLLNSLRTERQLGGSPSSQSSTSTTSEPEYTLFDMVTDMLYRLGQNVAMYVGDDVFFELDLPPRTADMGDPRTPFPSFEEADKLLDLVEESYDDFLMGPRPRVWPELWSDDPMLYDTFTASTTCFDPDMRKQALSASRMTFAIWNARFELTKKEKETVRLSPEEQRALAFLNMHQSIWSALVKLETIEEEFTREDSEMILERAEVLIKMEEQAKRPTFAFNGYLIPALSIVCGSCRDIDIQRRSISLLRSVRRREGIWDSQEVADVYETMIAATANNMVIWDKLPWGIPQLAAELSSLSLSDTAGSSPEQDVGQSEQFIF